MAIISLSSYYTQYLFILFLSLILINSNTCLGCIVSNLSQLFIALLLSYVLTSFIQRFSKKELLSSDGKAVLITGCDSGFGNLSALELNKHGFRVYATVFSTLNTGSQQLMKNARFSDKMKVMKMDVTNDEEVHEVYKEVKKDLDLSGHKLWAVVNNAGVACFGHIEWGTLETCKQLFEVNVFGLIRVTRVFLPLIRGSKGRIVNVGSIAGRYTFDNVSIYSMSKHAITSFTDALRREMHKWDVKVSSIEPGAFKTSIFTDEYFCSSIGKLWDDSSDDVKKDYGQKYFECQKKVILQFKKNFKASDKLSVVVNDIMDAIRNIEPKITYRPIDGILMQIIFFVCLYLPNRYYDQLSYFMNDSKPDHNQESE